MAARTVVVRVDDLDGSDLGDGGSTVSLAFQGVEYQLDLSDDNAAQLEAVLQPYLSVARRAGGRRRGGSQPSTSGKNTSEVRAWAKANGHEVNGRGRLPAEVVAAYNAANLPG